MFFQISDSSDQNTAEDPAGYRCGARVETTKKGAVCPLLTAALQKGSAEHRRGGKRQANSRRITMPSTIRYQPNTLKSCFLI